MDPAKLPRNFDMVSYWCSWTISLLVTGSNGFLQLFSLDKNYFSYSMVVEQLKTEGWQYFGLSGKYEDYPNHQSAYKTFSKSIESIKRKQIDQEFSSGKGDNKKKKFDFKGEMQKFAQEQNAELGMRQSFTKVDDILKQDKKEDEIKQDKKEDEIKQVKKEDEIKQVKKEDEKKDETKGKSN